ncbi:hypothetical protein EJB05_02482, partial [Eragrostis curvula]
MHPSAPPPVAAGASPAKTVSNTITTAVSAAAEDSSSREAAAPRLRQRQPSGTSGGRRGAAASAAVSRRVGEAVGLLERGRALQARGDFPEALASFTGVVREYADLALSEYARVGRALVLYEIGDRDESIAEMEDVSIALKGYPEIHAALAAALYADKHAALLAENQFAIATLLDPHYTDLAYVRDTKHWPPSLVASLHDFITLT